ncbi:hypothetical protein D1872_174720 [compost metagenome]
MPKMVAAAATPIFDGTANWGFTGSDIWTNVMLIVASLSTFVILGICIKFAPRVFGVIRSALFGSGRS